MGAARNHVWLLLAALFLALGGFLMNPRDERKAPTTRQAPLFPQALKADEWRRLEGRRSLPATPPQGDDALPVANLVRDPLLRALPAAASGFAVVIEANGLRHSELGEILVGCMSKRAARELEAVRKEYGVDLLEDLDRVALSGESMLVSGHFQEAQWGQIFDDAEPEAVGASGRLFSNAASGEVIGVWKNEMMIVAPTREAIVAAIDRIEGRAAPELPIPEAMTYGELYGLVDADRIAAVVDESEAGLAEKIRRIVEDVELHLDAENGVALTATFRGTDEAGLTDLGKSLGGALALGRMAAKAQGEAELADLLQYAKVSPHGSSFELELALPRELVQSYLKKACDLMGEEP